MCVAVSLMPGASLSDEEIYRMGTTNGDGVGIAWARDGKVSWYKTIHYKVGTVSHFINTHLDQPRLVHFRLATAGGTRVDLCHPFEISPSASCAATGAGDKVMIHNGHYGRWKELLEFLEKENLLPDKGPWSDTRLVAYLAHNDPDWLNVLGGKVAVLRGDGQFTHLGDWDDLHDGVKVSNKHWNREQVVGKGGYTGFKQWPGWGVDGRGWSKHDWEQYEAELQARAEERREEIKALIGDRVATKTKGTLVTEKDQNDEQKSTSVARSPGHVGKANWVRSRGQERDGEILPRSPKARSGTRAESKYDGPYVPETGSIGRVYERTPWTNPGTGAVYEVKEDGTVVKIASPLPFANGEGRAGVGSARSRGVASLCREEREELRNCGIELHPPDRSGSSGG